jgi:type IV pilus modification protein PilV
MNNPILSNHPAAPKIRKAGFTLIEVALAVAVVVIGLLALFALISAGLDASSKALADTHAAQFADNIYNGLRSRSLAEAEKGTAPNGNVYWRVFWRDFANSSETISVAASNYWDAATFDIQASPAAFGTYIPASRTVVFENETQHAGGMDDLVNHALRYRLEVHPNTVASWDLTDLENARVEVVTYIWPGEFGGTNNPLLFYSEFNNPGDL